MIQQKYIFWIYVVNLIMSKNLGLIKSIKIGISSLAYFDSMNWLNFKFLPKLGILR